MIHWAWLIPVLIGGIFIGSWAEHVSDKKVQRGVGLGVIGTLLVLLGLN